MGTGFRKKAVSKRAREERARAAERRQLALEASTNRTSGLEDDESDIEELPETDQERRQTMMDSMDTSEANQLKTGTLSDIWGGFIMPKRPLDNDHAAESKATGVNSQRTGNAPKRTPSPPALLQSTVRSELSKSQPRKLQPRDEKRALGQIAPHQERTFDATLPNSTTRGGTAHNITWSCLVCTLDNEPEHLACSACATPRGDVIWQQPSSDHI